jgi:hypothetical protein
LSLVNEYSHGGIIEQEAPQELSNRRPNDDWPPVSS